MTRTDIGNQLAIIRKDKEITQTEIQNITNINKSTISKIENGKFTGSLDILERYLDSLGYELAITPKKHKLPSWDDLDTLFTEDN